MWYGDGFGIFVLVLLQKLWLLRYSASSSKIPSGERDKGIWENMGYGIKGETPAQRQKKFPKCPIFPREFSYLISAVVVVVVGF